IYPLPLMVSAAYGLMIALMFALAPLARARAVSAASLFRSRVEHRAWPALPVLLAIIGLSVLVALLAIGTAREPRLAALFVGTVAVVLAALGVLGWGIRRLAARLPRPRRPLP